MDLASALAWYTQLAGTPGWREYAWRRVNDMARDYPAVFGDLPRLLTEAMHEKGGQG
jgi:hypothetical protein